VIEAMKMDNDQLGAGAPGTVAEARVRPGQTGNARVRVVIG
jgi:biotin carboxyl carrier protein